MGELSSPSFLTELRARFEANFPRFLDPGTMAVREPDRDDGSMAPVRTASGNELTFEAPRWSQVSGSFHARVAGGLASLARLVRHEKLPHEERYLTAARKICDFTLSFQEDSGRFRTDRSG